LDPKETDSSSSASDKKSKGRGRGSFLYNESTYNRTQGKFEETNDPRDSLSHKERDDDGTQYKTLH
jgi:hypothetical protein